MRRDAQELATLAQQIPPGVEKLSKNILSKDLIEQLKRSEKLAKQLRKEISPWLIGWLPVSQCLLLASPSASCMGATSLLPISPPQLDPVGVCIAPAQFSEKLDFDSDGL